MSAVLQGPLHDGIHGSDVLLEETMKGAELVTHRMELRNHFLKHVQQTQKEKPRCVLAQHVTNIPN